MAQTVKDRVRQVSRATRLAHWFESVSEQVAVLHHELKTEADGRVGTHLNEAKKLSNRLRKKLVDAQRGKNADERQELNDLDHAVARIFHCLTDNVITSLAANSTISNFSDRKRHV